MQAKDWLKKFLDDRQLSKSHGRPLYRYRMNEEEFDTLQLTLKTSALFGVDKVSSIGWSSTKEGSPFAGINKSVYTGFGLQNEVTHEIQRIQKVVKVPEELPFKKALNTPCVF